MCKLSVTVNVLGNWACLYSTKKTYYACARPGLYVPILVVLYTNLFKLYTHRQPADYREGQIKY